MRLVSFFPYNNNLLEAFKMAAVFLPMMVRGGDIAFMMAAVILSMSVIFVESVLHGNEVLRRECITWKRGYSFCLGTPMTYSVTHFVTHFRELCPM